MWDGKPQKLAISSGIQKGLKSLLEERGVITTTLKKEEMIKIVDMRDFKFQKQKWKSLF